MTKYVIVLILVAIIAVNCQAITVGQFHLLARLANCWMCDKSCDCFQVWNVVEDDWINWLDFAEIFGGVK